VSWPDGVLTAAVIDSRGRRQRGGNATNSLPTWATWSIAAAALLSLVLAFLMAIAVESFIGVLKDAGILEFLAVSAIGAISWLQLRRLRVRPRGSASVET
jgi:hypothetical protein